MKMKTTFQLCMLAIASLGSCAPSMAGTPTALQVGDADSFGNKSVWLGLVATGNVHLDSISCAPDPANPLGPDDRCVLLSAGGVTTNFAFTDLGRITLPGGSAETLLCQWATPTIGYTMANPTTGVVLGRFRASATYRLESDVLKDPALVNPTTGAPFNGYIDTTVSGLSTSQSLFAGAQSAQRAVASRDCIAGLMSQSMLRQTYGLSDSLAKKFFKGAITIRAGVTGSAAWVSGADINFSTRLMGDK